MCSLRSGVANAWIGKASSQRTLGTFSYWDVFNERDRDIELELEQRLLVSKDGSGLW
jgi:hypothetical protein